MTLLPSISPAGKLIVGKVVVPPAVTVNVPCALRYPSASARIRYVPGGTVKLNVPSTFAGMLITGVLLRLLTVIVTGLSARTCPFRVPAGRGVGVGEETGMDVDAAVGDASGVDVGGACVGEATGVSVITGVADGKVPVGVTGGRTTVGVEVGGCVSHVYVPTICAKIADSVA